MKGHEDETSYSPDVRAAIEALEKAERFQEIEGAYTLTYREYKRRLPQDFAYNGVLILFTVPLHIAWRYYAHRMSFDPVASALVYGAIVGVVLLVGPRVWRPRWATGLWRLVRAVEKWKAVAYAHAQERRQAGSDAT